MEEYPLLEFSDFENQRLSEFTHACEARNVKFIEFYVEVNNSEDFYGFIMPIINLLGDSLFHIQITEESDEYLAKISYKEASAIIPSRDKEYPHTSSIISDINKFLEKIGINKRLYIWPILEQGTVVFSHNPNRLASFHEAGGYDPTILNPEIYRVRLDLLSGVKTSINFGTPKSFEELNESFINSVNSLQKKMERKVLSSDRLGLFKRSPTKQILLIVNDQQLGHLSLGDNGAYMFGSGYTLLALREILLAHEAFEVRHVSIATKGEVAIQGEVLLELIRSVIESEIK